MGDLRRRLADVSGPPAWSDDPLVRLMQQIDWYLIMSGLVAQSRAAVPLERWARRLLGIGICNVPDLCYVASWMPDEVNVGRRLDWMIHDGAAKAASKVGDSRQERWSRRWGHKLRDEADLAGDPLAPRAFKGPIQGTGPF